MADSPKSTKKDEDSKYDDENWPDFRFRSDPAHLSSEPKESPKQYYYTQNNASNCSAVWKPETLVFSKSSFISPIHGCSSCQTRPTIGTYCGRVFVLCSAITTINHLNFPYIGGLFFSGQSLLNAFGEGERLLGS